MALHAVIGALAFSSPAALRSTPTLAAVATCDGKSLCRPALQHERHGSTVLVEGSGRGAVRSVVPQLLRRMRTGGLWLSESGTPTAPKWWSDALSSLLQSAALLNAAMSAQYAGMNSLMTQMLSIAGCSLLVLQLGCYQLLGHKLVAAPAVAGAGERVEATAGRCEPRSRARVCLSTASMNAAGAALLWQSLGGFGGTRTPEDNQLWNDFRNLDTDNNGRLTAVELQKALRRSSAGASSRVVAQRLVDFADVDDDGILDFAEYQLIRQAPNPTEYMLRYKKRWSC